MIRSIVPRGAATRSTMKRLTLAVLLLAAVMAWRAEPAASARPDSGDDRTRGGYLGSGNFVDSAPVLS